MSNHDWHSLEDIFSYAKEKIREVYQGNEHKNSPAFAIFGYRW